MFAVLLQTHVGGRHWWDREQRLDSVRPHALIEKQFAYSHTVLKIAIEDNVWNAERNYPGRLDEGEANEAIFIFVYNNSLLSYNGYIQWSFNNNQEWFHPCNNTRPMELNDPSDRA